MRVRSYWYLENRGRWTMNTSECAPSYLDTPTGLWVEFFTRSTDRRAAFGGGSEQMASQEAGFLGVGDREEVFNGARCCDCSYRTGGSHSAAANDLGEQISLRPIADLDRVDVTGSNELVGAASRDLDAPKRQGIEDCAWWATHY